LKLIEPFNTLTYKKVEIEFVLIKKNLVRTSFKDCARWLGLASNKNKNCCAPLEHKNIKEQK
jgi:hypothetical protein